MVLALHENAAENCSGPQRTQHRHPTEVEEGPRTFAAAGGVVKNGRLRQGVAHGARHGVYKHVQMLD